jgi:hypothetical protein
MDEKTLMEIQVILDKVRIHYILQEDEVFCQIEEWENGKINLLLIMPPRFSRVCKSCASIHFTKWFRTQYPDSIIANISLTNENQLNL